MKKRLYIILSILIMSLSIKASEPDMLVTQKGETLNVYNLDLTSSEYIYYTLSDDVNSPITKILKEDVLIIKKSDGTKIDPSQNTNIATRNAVVNPGAHDPVTHRVTSTFYSKKAKENILVVEDGVGQVLYMRILSDQEKTLSVTKYRGDGKSDYNEEKYVIPEYVEYQNETYTVVSVDDLAFYRKNTNYWKDKIKEIVFPSTLKSIGVESLCGRWYITKIILPESIERIGDDAFNSCGMKAAFEQLYIPKGVKYIGKNAFICVGNNISPRGYFQGNLTSMPDFITIGNCKNYGIDEEAVEAYEKRYFNK